MDNQLQFCTVEEAVEEIRQGRMIIVTDDPGRENEADLIIAAEFATPEAINFMVTHARGLVCAPLSPERADALQLPLMTSVNRENMSTAFTVSVDAAHDITTGISAAERSLTIRTLADPKATVNDFVQPGHTFPLRAVPGGVLRRAGHTEATIDLVRMAGLQPAGVCCEIMKEDGTMARIGDLGEFQKKHDLKACTVAQLIEYRRAKEKQIRLVETVNMPTDYGDFTCRLYESQLDGALHLALVHGEISPDKPTLVRVHSECLTGDVFGSRRCDCGSQLHTAMRRTPRKEASCSTCGRRAAASDWRQNSRPTNFRNRVWIPWKPTSGSAIRTTCATMASERKSCMTWEQTSCACLPTTRGKSWGWRALA